MKDAHKDADLAVTLNTKLSEIIEPSLVVVSILCLFGVFVVRL